MSDGTPFLRVAADRIGAPGSPAKMPFRATNAANWSSIIRIGAKMAVIRRQIARRAVSSHTQRAGKVPSGESRFITLAAESALEAARQAEREIAAGNYRGPLHGIPIGLKDVFNTAGIRTTNGSSFYRDYVPKEDAAAVRTLRDAGAVIIGKCNLHEFAGGSTTNNPWYGAARNPWNLERSPGGSSGGSGAAVAAFLCPGATGTDTGGSIRGPAACNGIVGLKPTYGRVSLRGIFPNSWSLDTAGPIARTPLCQPH